MNKARRKLIQNIIDGTEKIISGGQGDVEHLRERLEDVLLDEEYAFDSMPENLQYSMRGEESQEAIDLMTEAIEKFEEEDLEEVVDLLTSIY